MSSKNVVTISRPKDRSLKSFKEWINSLAAELIGDTGEDDRTEEEWIDFWKEFWGKSDKGKTG